MLLDLNMCRSGSRRAIDEALQRIEATEQIELDELQRQAAETVIANGLTVITGGPGTGKTTTINTILRYFEQRGQEILNWPRPPGGPPSG